MRALRRAESEWHEGCTDDGLDTTHLDQEIHMGEQVDDRGLPSGFQRTGDEDMDDADLQETAKQADPDDLGGTAPDSGLTAGGTDTTLDLSGR